MSKKHKELVDLAVKALKDSGCHIVKVEYSFKGHKIDVVGFKGNSKIAVECGNIENILLFWLLKNFDYVIKIPYEGLIQFWKKTEEKVDVFDRDRLDVCAGTSVTLYRDVSSIVF